MFSDILYPRALGPLSVKDVRFQCGLEHLLRLEGLSLLLEVLQTGGKDDFSMHFDCDVSVYVLLT